MRILALDYGSKRVGVAVSDEMRVIAQPVGYWETEPFPKFLEQLKRCLIEREIVMVLVGMPRNMDGSYGPAALKVQEFLGVLRNAITVPVETWDERLTTAQANRVMVEAGVRREKRKTKVDSLAAAVLLQSYLDARSV